MAGYGRILGTGLKYSTAKERGEKFDLKDLPVVSTFIGKPDNGMYYKKVFRDNENVVKVLKQIDAKGTIVATDSEEQPEEIKNKYEAAIEDVVNAYDTVVKRKKKYANFSRTLLTILSKPVT